MPAKPRILVVDDLESEMIGRMLRLKGYEVDMATSAEEALAMITPGYYSLFMLDGAMPEMDGFTLARRLREMGYREPVIFVTAFESEMTGPHAAFIGNAQVLPKPIDPPDFYATVATTLEVEIGAVMMPETDEIH
jgi:DNA-binding response OmpR family regulator